MTSTATLIASEVATQAVEPTVFHYFKNSAITRSLVLGTKETALCGYTATCATAVVGGGTERRSSVTVCLLCQNLYNLLGGPK